MSGVSFGVFLPTFVYGDGRSGDEIARFARRAEELGFDSLWATDHLLHGSLFYAVPWLEPMITLAYAACATSRIDLGTSILVMPTRHPVVLAKEISTLQSLCGDRFLLGAGTGWDAREFAAVGTEKRVRGQETDEFIDLVSRLVAGEEVDHEGVRVRLEGVQIAPASRRPLRVWAAGGRQVAHEKSPEKATMARTVLERIGRADGWIARPTATPEQLGEDIEEITAHLEDIGRDPREVTLAHENFLHLVPSDDPEEVRREQVAAYTRVMGTRRPFEYFEQVYLTGTTEEILKKIQARLDHGIEHVLFHTLEPSVAQLELWAEHLVPHLKRA